MIKYLTKLKMHTRIPQTKPSYLLPKINEPFDILCLLQSIEALLQDTVPDVVYLGSEQWSAKIECTLTFTICSDPVFLYFVCSLAWLALVKWSVIQLLIKSQFVSCCKSLDPSTFLTSFWDLVRSRMIFCIQKTRENCINVQFGKIDEYF